MTPAANALPLGDPVREALVVLGAVAIVIPLLHRLRLSPILAYLLIGFLAGPSGLGAFEASWPPIAWVTITDRARIEPLAELGVALLMFTIGLEMSWGRVKALRRLMLGLGVLQVGGSTVLLGAGLAWFGLPAGAAAVAAFALAMSSTAVVTQVLAEERRITSLTGRACFAVLLLQDVSVVPILFLLSAVAGQQVGSADLVRAVGLALGTIVLLGVGGRLMLRPLFRSVAGTRSPELFMAACLLVVLGTGVTAQAAGLSMALGALVSGLLLAETEYRRQIEVTLEPFKGLLLGVFLISVGLRLDASVLARAPAAILAGTIAFACVKASLAWAAGRLTRLRADATLQSALLLAPGGEFGFVIIGSAGSAGVIAPGLRDAMFLSVALSMACIPALSWLGRRLAPARPGTVPEAMQPETGGAENGVIIAGFGRVGRTVATLLSAHNIAYVGLDSDAGLVAARRRAGENVFYGDSSQEELLRRVGLETARAIVVTIDHRDRADSIVQAARSLRPELLIVARARDSDHAAHLYRMGASDAVPETVEASLQLSEALLIDLGVAMGPVLVSIHEQRARFQAEIKARAPQATLRRLGRRRITASSGPD